MSSRSTDYRQRKRKIDKTAESLKKVCTDDRDNVGAGPSSQIDDDDEPTSTPGSEPQSELAVGPPLTITKSGGSFCGSSDLEDLMPDDNPPQESEEEYQQTFSDTTTAAVFSGAITCSAGDNSEFVISAMPRPTTPKISSSSLDKASRESIAGSRPSDEISVDQLDCDSGPRRASGEGAANETDLFGVGGNSKNSSSNNSQHFTDQEQLDTGTGDLEGTDFAVAPADTTSAASSDKQRSDVDSENDDVAGEDSSENESNIEEVIVNEGPAGAI